VDREGRRPGREVGIAFALAGLLLGGFAAFFAYEAAVIADGALDAVVLAAAAAGGAFVAVGTSRLLQRHGPLPGRVPLLLLVTAPLWGRVPATGRVAIFGAYAGYFGGLVALIVKRARARRV
jgi:hypothetical protein